MLTSRILSLALTTVLTLCVLPVRAAETGPPTGRLAVNVLGLATANPTLDAEWIVSDGFGIGGTVWWEVREVQDRWGQLRAAWYPFRTAPFKLGVAATVGAHTAYRPDGDPLTIREDATAATLGGLVQYGWSLGAERRWTIEIVTGAKATLGENGDDSPLQKVYIEGRLNVGWVF